MGALVPKYYMFRRGCVGNTSMCDGPHAGVFSTGRTTSAEARVVFPRRALRAPKGNGGSPPSALSAPKGEWPYTEATPNGAAPTSPPEGVFRHKRLMELDELSGRTTGRLGYTWPTTAYAIGGTATLALRYSYHLRICRRPHSSSVMTAGRRELLEDGHRRRFRWGRRTFRGTTGRMEQRAD